MRPIMCVLVTILANTGCVHADDPDDAASAQRRAETKQRHDRLMSEYEAIERKLPAPRETPTSAAGCDATGLARQGIDESFRDNHHEALRLYEASLACEFQPVVARYAFIAACRSNNAARAHVHLEHMDLNHLDRERYRTACAAFAVDTRP